MKHRFLLDENILYHAIKGVDKHDNPDLTCAELMLLIARNCHTITLNRFLQRRYAVHMKELERVNAGVLQPIFLLRELIHNADKVVMEYDDPPALPEHSQIPREDIDVVRAALISHPIFVTAEDDLREAISKCEALHLRAMRPTEALDLAREI